MTGVRMGIFSGLLSFLCGACGKQSPPAAPDAAAPPPRPLSAPPEVTSEQEEGFRDVVLYIAEHRRLPDGSQVVLGAGLHNGRRVGLEVVLGPTWKKGAVDPRIPFDLYQGTVTYRSTGEESDAFVQVLDETYGTKVSPGAMGKETVFTGLSLEGDPRDLGKGPVKIKLFFEADEEDRYAELFTNVDLAARRLDVREKDPEYRLPLVKALQAR